MQTTERLVIIDISYWQGPIDKEKLRAQYEAGNLHGIIARVGFGLRADEKFEQNYAVMEALPELLRGVYFYLSSGSPWRAQFEFVLKTVGDKTIDFYNLDVEDKYNHLGESFARAAVSFMGVMKEKGLTLLYTNKWIYEFLQKWAPEFDTYPLWFAQYPYGVFSQWLFGWVRKTSVWPRLPATVKKSLLFIWQYTDKGPGIAWGMGSHGLDMNVLTIPYDEFIKEIGGLPERWQSTPADDQPNAPLEPSAGMPSTIEQFNAMQAMELKRGVDIGRVLERNELKEEIDALFSNRATS